jgi:hypothetical protein
MKRRFAALLGLSIVAITGCNNDLGNYVVGVPTVYPNFVQASGSYDGIGQTTGGYQVAFKVAPGSPAGIVQAFIALDGTLLPVGAYVIACSLIGSDGKPREQTCDGGTSASIDFSVPGDVKTLRIKGMKVQGLNGLSKDVQWSGEIPLVPVRP